MNRWEELYVECLTKTNAYKKWTTLIAERIAKWGTYVMSDSEVRACARECVEELDSLGGEKILRNYENSLNFKKNRERRLHEKGQTKELPAGSIIVEPGISPLKAAERETKKRITQRPG